MRPDDHDTAAGEPSMPPPKDSQPLQPPANHLCQSALSAPLTKVSSLSPAHELTAGPAVMMPPRDSQLLHAMVNLLVEPTSVVIDAQTLEKTMTGARS